MVSTIRWVLAGAALFCASAATFACNALLDNQAGTLLVDGGDDGGTSAASDDADTAATGACPTGTKSCFGTCVDVLHWEFGCTDLTTCNACSFDHATAFQSCPSGACGLQTCNTGYADCNADASDGCEANLTEFSSCGVCGKSCSGSTPFCVPVDGGYGCSINCPLTTCGTNCVDVKTSLDNCGGCGARCTVTGGTPSCTNGTCSRTCAPSTHLCSAGGGAYSCASDLDTAHCGASCVDCNAAGPPLAAHQVRACTGGACAVGCAPGWADCDQNAGNGCETDLTRDEQSCGACGHDCGRHEVCCRSKCQPDFVVCH